MSCDRVQRQISDSLAAGAGLPRAVRDHAESCPACRAALEREQALFAALQSGLRVRANADVGADFLLRVRARIAEASVPRRAYFPAWAAALSMTAVALALTIGFVVRLHRAASGGPTENFPPVARNIPSAGSVSGSSLPPEAFAPPTRSTRRDRPSLRTALRYSPVRTPEVIVSQEDRLAFVRLMEELQHTASAGLTTQMLPLVPGSEPLPVADIKIDELEVKPLSSDAGHE